MSDTQTHQPQPRKRGPKPMPAGERERRKEDQRLRHNAKRRLSYKTDPNYRDQNRRAARERFRKANGTPPGYDCREALPTLGDDAVSRIVYLHKREMWGEAPTFTVKELSNPKGSADYGVLGVSMKTLNKWIHDGLIPEPVLTAYVVTGSFGRPDQTSNVRVYHRDEVQAIIEHLGPHQAEVKVFRREHQRTVVSIAQAVHHVREIKGFI